MSELLSSSNSSRESKSHLLNDNQDTKETIADRAKVTVKDLFKFVTLADKFFILFGSMFAIIEGAGASAFALVFGSMTNMLIEAVKRDFQPPERTRAHHERSARRNFHFSGAHRISQSIQEPERSPVMDTFESQITSIGLLFVLIGIITYMSSFFKVILLQTASERQARRTRLALFRSILRRKLHWFERHSPSRLSRTLSLDVETIRKATGEQLGIVIEQFSRFLSSFLLGFFVSWQLTALNVALTPILGLAAALLKRNMVKLLSEETQIYTKANNLAEQVLNKVRTVFALGGQWIEIKRYREELNKAKRAAFWVHFCQGLITGASVFVFYLFYAVSFYIVSRQLFTKRISPGEAITVIMVSSAAASAFAALLAPLEAIARAVQVATNVFGILNSKHFTISHGLRGLCLPKKLAGIKFDKVTFSYPSRNIEPVLYQFSMEINQGQTVALCSDRAGTDSCKAVLDLLLRFYDPNSGTIYLDNCDLRELNLAWLRSSTGLVELEPALFDGTIFDNIVLGAFQSFDESSERVIEAAKQANAHEFIMNMPQGYATQIKQLSIPLTTGQRQRIALARALLSSPRILLLDETSISLDHKSDFIFQSALNKARQGRIVIAITNRLSTIREADLVCVLAEGRVVEEGRYDGLVERKGEYYKLLNDQVFIQSKLADSPLTGSESSLTIEIDSDVTEYFKYKAIPIKGKKFKPQNSITLYESNNQHAWSHNDLGNQRIPDQSREPTILDIYNLLKPNPGLLIASFIVWILYGLSWPVFALLYAEIFETFTQRNHLLLDFANFWSLMYLAIGLVNLIVDFFRVFITAQLADISMVRLRSKLFQKLMRHSAGWFDLDANSPKILSNCLASDIAHVKTTLVGRILNQVAQFSGILLALSLGFFFSWKLAVVLVFILPAILLINNFQMRYRVKTRRENDKRLEEDICLATEVIEQVKVIQSINKEAHFFNKFRHKLKNSFRHNLSSTGRSGLLQGLDQSIFYFMYAIAYIWAAHLLVRHTIDVATVYRVFFVMASASTIRNQRASGSDNIIEANRALVLVMRLLGENSDNTDNLGAGGVKPKLDGTIAFRNIYFAYPMRLDLPILHDINLTVNTGQTLALVGTAGSGDYDIRCVNLAHLRSQIAYFTRDPSLFKATIKENILYGLEEYKYSMRDVVEAAKQAKIDDFIVELPSGYNTLLDDSEVCIPEARKHQIAIARALIRKPSIIIVDEVTSDLDPDSQALVENVLNQVTKGKTCIRIEHRPKLVQRAHQIAVIDNGTVVEVGSFDELLVKKGIYYHLMEKLK